MVAPGARWVLIAACWLQACAAGAPAPPPPPTWDASRAETAAALEVALARGSERAAGTLRVRLAFAGTADLDLYVTDPQLETLYYANTPVRSGGVLAEDQRCDAQRGAAPRIEVVDFSAPLEGRYRVGVDYPSACDGDEDVAPYALSIEWDGGRRELRGLAEPLRFEPIVIEFDLP